MNAGGGNVTAPRLRRERWWLLVRGNLLEVLHEPQRVDLTETLRQEQALDDLVSLQDGAARRVRFDQRQGTAKAWPMTAFVVKQVKGVVAYVTTEHLERLVDLVGETFQQLDDARSIEVENAVDLPNGVPAPRRAHQRSNIGRTAAGAHLAAIDQATKNSAHVVPIRRTYAPAATDGGVGNRDDGSAMMGSIVSLRG